MLVSPVWVIYTELSIKRIFINFRVRKCSRLLIFYKPNLANALIRLLWFFALYHKTLARMHLQTNKNLKVPRKLEVEQLSTLVSHLDLPNLKLSHLGEKEHWKGTLKKKLKRRSIMWWNWRHFWLFYSLVFPFPSLFSWLSWPYREWK